MAKGERTEVKLCPKCGELKSRADFHRGPNRVEGLAYQCKGCVKIYRKQYHERNRQRWAGVTNRPKDSIKRCSRCGELKIWSEFYKSCIKSDGLSDWCKECKKAYYRRHRQSRLEYGRQYRQNNRERLREAQKRYYQEHLEVRRASSREYYAKNREARKAYGRKFYADHREAEKVRHRKGYREHREARLAYQKKYNVEHREARRAYAREYRARKRKGKQPNG